MTTKFWIEKAWGDSVDNATFNDIKVAIQETLNMDDEHGAFWVGNYDNEYTMEIHKDLKLFFNPNSNPNDQITTHLNSREEVEKLYLMFMDNRYENIELELRKQNTHPG